MLITNQTAQDYWFGPLHLDGGVGQTLTVDDTSATSLYLTDDGVADAINSLYASGKITVSSAANPFPRPTGTPDVLHGDGAPEGMIYGGQGSIFLRRDNGSVYSKTTGVHFNTGWRQLAAGATTTVSSLAGGPPASPSDGDIWIATGVDGNGARWQFQYDAGSSSPYKWSFIGGAPLAALTNPNTSLTAAGSWTRAGFLTNSRAGDYIIRSWAYIQKFTNPGSVALNASINNGTSLISSSNFGNTWAQNVGGVGYYVGNEMRVTNATAGGSLDVWAQTSTDTAQVSNLFMAVMPVRVS